MEVLHEIASNGQQCYFCSIEGCLLLQAHSGSIQIFVKDKSERVLDPNLKSSQSSSANVTAAVSLCSCNAMCDAGSNTLIAAAVLRMLHADCGNGSYGSVRAGWRGSNKLSGQFWLPLASAVMHGVCLHADDQPQQMGPM